MPRSWMGVVCDNDRSRSAVHSWFESFHREAMTQEAAEQDQGDADAAAERAWEDRREERGWG